MGKEWDKLGAGVETANEGTDKSHPFRDGQQRIRYGKSVANMQEWHRLWAIEALRVLKPGAHALVFGGTRTHHRLMCGLEDAGFEIRDCVMWVYGSGFPKSLDVSKAIDKQGEGQYRRAYVQAVQEAGLVLPNNSKWDWTVGEHSPGNKWWAIFCEWLPSLSEIDQERINRIVIGKGFKPRPTFHTRNIGESASANEYDITAPATDEAKQWNGWGTALKPAWEPVIVVRKPLEQGLTVAQNVLKWGTGALNIDGCRVETSENLNGGAYSGGSKQSKDATSYYTGTNAGQFKQPQGRWPANLIHDGSDEVVSLFPTTTSGVHNGQYKRTTSKTKNTFSERMAIAEVRDGDTGSAARFFYTAKASGSDRGNRIEPAAPLFGVDEPEEFRNTHPTVKPIVLMEYLIKLITPPDGVLLDCFLGSGSTLVAAKQLGRRAIGIEQDQESCKTAVMRLSPSPS